MTEDRHAEHGENTDRIAPELPGGAEAVVLHITHETIYRYGDRVSLAHHLAYLHPLNLAAGGVACQEVGSYSLSLEPEASRRSTGHDAFGNRRELFAHYLPHDELTVRAQSRVSVRARFSAARVLAGTPWEAVRDSLRFRVNAPYVSEAEFSFASPYIPLHAQLAAYAQPSFSPGRPVIEAAIDLMRRINADFTYAPDVTEISTPLLEAWTLRSGVCQDFSHVMIGALRALGLAARYVSGYLLTQPPPGKARLIGADASHAWVAVWCPVLGWVDLDPTNALLPGAGADHVTLAYGRDYGDVAPLRGVIRGAGAHTLDVAVTVAPSDI